MRNDIIYDDEVSHLCSEIFKDIEECFQNIRLIKEHCYSLKYDFIADRFLKYPESKNGKIEFKYIDNYLRFYCYIDLMNKQYSNYDWRDLKKIIINTITILSKYCEVEFSLKNCQYNLNIDCFYFEDGEIAQCISILLFDDRIEFYKKDMFDYFVKIGKIQNGFAKLEDLSELLFLYTVVNLLESHDKSSTSLVGNLQHCILKMLEAIEIKYTV